MNEELFIRLWNEVKYVLYPEELKNIARNFPVLQDEALKIAEEYEKERARNLPSSSSHINFE